VGGAFRPRTAVYGLWVWPPVYSEATTRDCPSLPPRHRRARGGACPRPDVVRTRRPETTTLPHPPDAGSHLEDTKPPGITKASLCSFVPSSPCGENRPPTTETVTKRSRSWGAAAGQVPVAGLGSSSRTPRPRSNPAPSERPVQGREARKCHGCTIMASPGRGAKRHAGNRAKTVPRREIRRKSLHG
jgi:hypothetical protein